MELLPVSIVENWHEALNAPDHEQLAAIMSDDVEVISETGWTCGRAAHRQWIGFTAEPLRWFCGPVGVVVVEQLGCWLLPPIATERVVASAFRVSNGRVVRYRRFDVLGDALAATSLSDDDEVLARATLPAPPHQSVLTFRLKRAG